MQTAQSQGSCVYWGYWQTEQGWSKVMDILLMEPPIQNVTRLCIEAHYPIDAPSVVQRHQMLMQLKSATRQQSMMIVETTRVREPLDFYLSYFKWTIAGHQLRNEAGYNSTFLEWCLAGAASVVQRAIARARAPLAHARTPAGMCPTCSPT